MNYKPLIKIKLEELMDEASDLSFGEILHSFLRKSMLDEKPEEKVTAWLTEIKDEEIYTALEKAIKFEKN